MNVLSDNRRTSEDSGQHFCFCCAVIRTHTQTDTMARSVPALQRVHRSFDLCRTSEEQKTMFVSRFSRAEHADTLVSWIEAESI